MTLPEPFDLEAFMEEARDDILDHGHVVHFDDSPSPTYRS